MSPKACDVVKYELIAAIKHNDLNREFAGIEPAIMC
jgi:hypothetical protein